MPSHKTYVAWDIGATKCAAGIVEVHNDHHFQCVKSCRHRLRDCDSLAHLLQLIESDLDVDTRSVDGVGIAGAGIYNGHTLIAQNPYPYPMHLGALAEQHRWPQVQVMHDYSAVALATLTSYIDSPDNVAFLVRGAFNPFGRRVMVGVGTGLGVKDLVYRPDGHFWLGDNELGHMGLVVPPHAHPDILERQRALQVFLRTSGILGADEALTFEKILSGKGTVRLHQFATRQSQCDAPVTPEILGHKMRSGEAQDSMSLFAWYLGLLVGTLQLIFMPSGGIWITGGVILQHLDVFDHPEFYRGIEATPAYATQRATFPLAVLKNADHALIGAAYAVHHANKAGALTSSAPQQIRASLSV